MNANELARRSLAAYYASFLSMSEAETEANRVVDLVVRAHFSFPPSSPPEIPAIARLLLEGAPAGEAILQMEGRDPDKPLLDGWGVGVEPPLFLAVHHPRLVWALLSVGASPNVVNSFGKTPLMYAAQFGTSSSIRALLSAGADVTARTRTQHECGYTTVNVGDRTALHYAAAHASPEAMRVLVEAGADRGAKDSRGRMPVDLLTDNRKLTPQQRDEATRLLAPVP